MNETCREPTVLLLETNDPVTTLVECSFHLAWWKDRTEAQRVRTFAPTTEDVAMPIGKVTGMSWYETHVGPLA
jgi:hypothetical protein